jgi:hypothetical protein
LLRGWPGPSRTSTPDWTSSSCAGDRTGAPLRRLGGDALDDVAPIHERIDLQVLTRLHQ